MLFIMTGIVSAEHQDEYTHIGSYYKNVLTGEERFIPSEEVFSTNSLELEGSSPGYFPKGLEALETRGIIGSENRQLVTNTQVGPYISTCYIEANWGNNSYRGSGFIIGPNAVVTSGHVIYNSSLGGWPSSCKVWPARDGDNKYYESYAIAYEAGGNYVNNNDNQDDWGIITLADNLGDKTGWLGLRWQSNDYSGTVTLQGYPKEIGGNTNNRRMYKCVGSITGCSSRTIVTNADSSGGQSGGPMYKYYADTGYTAIGIIRGEGTGYNDGLRIDEWLYNKFISFRNKRT